MITGKPAPEKAQSPRPPGGSRRPEPPSPIAEAVTVESGSDADDEEQPPRLDAPELDLGEDVVGRNGAEPLEDRPSGGGEGRAAGASPRAPPTGLAQGAGDEGRLALGRPVLAPSMDGAAEAPAATATATPTIPTMVEDRSLAPKAAHLSGLGGSSSPGGLSEGHTFFTQARLAVNQMEQALASCQEELRAREAALNARETKMA